MKSAMKFDMIKKLLKLEYDKKAEYLQALDENNGSWIDAEWEDMQAKTKNDWAVVNLPYKLTSESIVLSAEDALTLVHILSKITEFAVDRYGQPLRIHPQEKETESIQIEFLSDIAYKKGKLAHILHSKVENE